VKQPPASIRFNNPGAQYPGPSARKYGSTGTEIIGGGHQIAVFDDPVKGAAAQFDLLNRAYAGMTLQDAIRKWSGGNSSGAYAQRISEATGIPLDGVLTPEILRNPQTAINLARTSADWEAGGKYPMSDEQWQEAHRMSLGGPSEARGGSMNGGYGMSPVGAGGIAGPIHTAEPASINSQFVDLKQPALPMMALGGPTSGSVGFGGLDFNDPQLGQAIGQFGNALAGMMKAPSPPSVQMARAQAPRVNFATVAQILANRRKPGNRNDGGRGL